MIRILTSGESHGPSLAFILEGLPAGLYVDTEFVNSDLSRRQRGHGRGQRMRIESDRVEFVAGLRQGYTIGSPLCGLIRNRDHKSWSDVMSADPLPSCSDARPWTGREVFAPRPGHADLAGLVKYGFPDARNVLERASARETATRVAAGAVCKLLLAELNVRVYSHVISIGGISTDPTPEKVIAHYDQVEASPVRCLDSDVAERMIEEIESALSEGDSIGGVFEVIAVGIPVGVGSYVHFDRRLDAAISGALMSIPGVKGVEFGAGFRVAELRGSKVHDEVEPSDLDPRGYRRLSNNAGGIEGGVSNGEPIVVRAAMKPIPTLRKPLRTLDIRDGSAVTASYERSDVCAVPAAGIVGEAMVALELAKAVVEKYGGDSIDELKAHLQSSQTSLPRPNEGSKL